jgi:hypothetical protein
MFWLMRIAEILLEWMRSAPVLGAGHPHGKVTIVESVAPARWLRISSDFFAGLGADVQVWEIRADESPMALLSATPLNDQLGELVRVLWRQRTLIETLQYRLEVQQLLCASGRDARLQLAVDEVEAAMDDLRRAERQRDDIVRGCSGQLGLGPDATLAEIRDRVDEPFKSLLADHQAALLSLVAEAEELARHNRELALRGANNTRALLDAVTGGSAPSPYGPHAVRGVLGAPALLDREA